MRATRWLCILASLVLTGAACGNEEGDTAAVEQTLTVEAFDFYFDPTTLRADTGAAVTIEFTNAGSVSHSWTSSDLGVEVEAGSGEESSVTFTAPAEPGSFDYFCEYHPDEMQGTISIGGSDDPVEDRPGDDDDDEDVDVDVDVDEEDPNDDAGAGPGDNY